MNANKLTLKSYAKLNLFLKVLNLRKDNYHNLETIFERIDLHDRIILKSLPGNSIKISCNNPSVPVDSKNLCYRAALLLQKAYKVDKGVEIKIIKKIPVGSGMGGGSSNAATTLLGLNKLWRLGASRKKLVQLAKKIGADVPFFIYDTPFAKGTKRGDEIKPLGALKDVRIWHILVVPKIHVSTPSIFKKWDSFCVKNSYLAGLTSPVSGVKILTSVIRKNALSNVGESLFNSLEAVTISLYPEVGSIEYKLSKLGLKSILMSGSGPAVFGVVASRKEALRLEKQLRSGSTSWQAFVVRTH